MVKKFVQSIKHAFHIAHAAFVILPAPIEAEEEEGEVELDVFASNSLGVRSPSASQRSEAFFQNCLTALDRSPVCSMGFQSNRRTPSFTHWIYCNQSPLDRRSMAKERSNPCL
jgi:hypothetical protein